MTVQVPSSAVHADGSVSVQEAAAVLGCSEKTVRRRIKAGALPAHRLPTSQGYEWRVRLDGGAGQVDGQGDQVPPLPADQVPSHSGPATEGAIRPPHENLDGAVLAPEVSSEPANGTAPPAAPGRAGGGAVHPDTQAFPLPGGNGCPAMAVSDQVDGAPVFSSEAALLRAIELTDRLQRENMELAGRLGFLQAKLLATEERLLALSPGEPAEDPTEPAQADAKPAPLRPWWKFWKPA